MFVDRPTTLALKKKKMLWAKWEVGQIQLVTSRLLGIGLKPDKKQSASFEFNKIIPFCAINSTEVTLLGYFVR